MVSRTSTPVGLRFAGEIDMSNCSAVEESLRVAFPTEGDPHFDVTNLSFCDISGIRALVDCARSLGPDRHLRLHGLPDQLATVMRATGWADLPCLVLCECEVGST